MRRPPFIGIFVAALALALLATPPALAQEGPTLAPCSGLPELPAARCGSVHVPLDRANPGLGTTEVAFALVPRRDTSRPSLGTIVYNPGGPGAAAINAEGADVVKRFGFLRRRRDVLLVDPRGTGRSEALRCRAFSDPAGLALAPRRRGLAAVGACGRELGNRAGLYGTAAVADDLEAVRATLGLERLDLWGDSYGTYLMPIYAARHPGHVRSMVLSGAAPLDFDPWGRDRLAAARQAIRLVCARTRACRGGPVLRDLARLATRLRRKPMPFTVSAGGRRFSARIDEGALAALVYAGGIPYYYGRIPAAAASALAGDTAPLRRLVGNYALAFAAFSADPSFSSAQNVATACHDYPRAFSYADPPAARRVAYERALAAIDPSEFRPFSPEGWTEAGFDAVDNCIEWPNDPTAGPPLAPGTPLPDVPVLVLSGDLDANTPSLAGRQAAAQFRRATFVEIPNAGHTPTGAPCADAVARRFIATLTANPRACAGTGQPPQVSGRPPLHAARLPLIGSAGSRAQRRTLGLVVATIGDLQEQAPIIQGWGSAGGLRGGRYVATRNRTIRLLAVRVVFGARVSGALTPLPGDRLKGTLRLTGPRVAHGRLLVRLGPNGHGRATGMLEGRHVDLAFR